ncbi:hypothetical protein [Cellulomonas sp. S1-8]|uniref:hypothetical protein n=1 Tax=Cellulomonas sp. S1-8 TaxID=2904790 RepID=UPI002244C52A|nr:hypothetical protein [Cellulomonas sp. S1-8]UZN04725.1 hypothetical protein OKX07_07415 [Cellulomonas sp. S1-8]
MGRRTRDGSVAVVLATVLATVLALTGCTGDEPQGPDGTAAPSASGTAAAGTPGGTADEETDVRTRLTQALQDDTTGLGDLVAKDDTSLTVLDTPWLDGWQVVDVLSRSGAHGARAYLALSDEGVATLLTGRTDAYVDLLTEAGVQVDDEGTAAAVVETYLDSTRTFRQWSQRIASFDDVQLRPTLDDAAQATVDAARAQLATEIGPTTAQPRGDGFDVEAWMQDGDVLVRHDVRVTSDGELSDRPSTQVSGLPVPISR